MWDNKDARNALSALDYKKHLGTDRSVFMGQRGTITVRGIQFMFRKVFKGSNVSDVTPHQLRHSFCKNLVNAGISLEKVAILAGHESLDTTKIYCKPSLHDLDKAVAMIGEEEIMHRIEILSSHEAKKFLITYFSQLRLQT